jgi:hypothetical protein
MPFQVRADNQDQKKNFADYGPRNIPATNPAGWQRLQMQLVESPHV